MERATDNETNAMYNDETLFLEGIFAFHPDIYNSLSVDDQQILQKYYLIGQPIPENIFEYRRALLQDQPAIEAKAKAVFAKILATLKIAEFPYSQRTVRLQERNKPTNRLE